MSKKSELAYLKKIQGIVMHSMPYKDSSLIIDFFSKEIGRISLFAPGARRIKSPLRGNLERYSICELIIHYKDTREIQVVKEGTTKKIFPSLRENPEKFFISGYILDFLKDATEKYAPLEHLYTLTKCFLKAINEEKEEFWKIIISYLIKCLKILGISPYLSSCRICKENYALNFYIPEKGGIICDNCLPKSSFKKDNAVQLKYPRTTLEYELLRDKKFKDLKRIKFYEKEEIFSILKTHTDFYLQDGILLRFEAFI